MRYHGLFIVAAAGAVLAGCQPRDRGTPADATAMRGGRVSPPFEKPAFTLTATDGTPFAFREETDGYLTLLFFGYTHCPDICPVHMANIAAVLRDLPPSERQRIKVVFVTTDPARDSLARIRSWLDNFDREFIGLTGDAEEIARAQASMAVRPAERGEAQEDGSYLVGHAASVFAFTPRDDRGHFLYPFGIRQADWAHDLPKLLEGDWET